MFYGKKYLQQKCPNEIFIYTQLNFTQRLRQTLIFIFGEGSMKKYTVYLLGITFGSCMLAMSAAAEPGLIETFQQSVVKINFRLRYEDVSWDGLQDSDAFTIRSRLSYQSGAYQGFGFSAEFDDIRELDSVEYRTAPNDPLNPGTTIIADPEGTEINQAFLSYGNLITQVKYGRQRIILDNQRFVGGVGWRQNEQTYDAFSIADKSLFNTNIFYAYVTNVNRVFGEHNIIGDHDQETHFLNVNYGGFSAGKLTVYAYLIDNLDALALASDTFGARWMGRINEIFSYNAEYAVQSDAGDNPVSYSTDYLLLESIASLGEVTATLGYEVLGSDDGNFGFSTPLATLHLFQGWTDRFLDTPAAGVEDIYATVATTLADVQLSASYHQLASDVNSIDYGKEFDLSASKKFGPVIYTAKYAEYQSDEFGSDTKKIWLMADINF